MAKPELNSSYKAAAETCVANERSYQEVQQALRRDPAFDEIFNELYKQLRKVAASIRREFEPMTISPTELLHEASMKMMRTPSLAWKDPLHFKRIAALAMKQILIDAVRRRRSERNGGGLIRVMLSDSLDVTVTWDESMLDLDRLLEEFGEQDSRAAQALDMNFFGGFTVSETAAALHISESSAAKDLQAARAFLLSRMGGHRLKVAPKVTA